VSHVVPQRVGLVQRGALVAGVLGLALCGLGFATNPGAFYRAYLVAYLFWVGTGVGCLSLVMIHHLTGGMWGLVIRRILEAATRTLKFAPLFFLPILLGLPHIYPWADQARIAADEGLRKVMAEKALYLNAPFFAVRAGFYFMVWIGLAELLNKWSLQLDAGENLRISRRLRGLSGGGLIFMGLTITFASVDWAMSLDPSWFSTIYGILFMVGQALSALALVIVMLSLLARDEPFAGVVVPGTLHDLGKLLFAFVMLWTYVNLSQFIIVWSGNLPEEIPWYLHRLHGGWQFVAALIVAFHFVLPFFVLLSRDVKKNPALLANVAGLLFLLRFVDLYWLVGPELHHAGVGGMWMDAAAVVGVGGVWVWLFAWQLKNRPLLPIGEPEIRELVAVGGR
jgi:hypothetical protein